MKIIKIKPNNRHKKKFKVKIQQNKKHSNNAKSPVNTQRPAGIYLADHTKNFQNDKFKIAAWLRNEKIDNEVRYFNKPDNGRSLIFYPKTEESTRRINAAIAFKAPRVASR